MDSGLFLPSVLYCIVLYCIVQAWVLSKMQLHQGTLVALLKKACDMVHRDQFTQCLATLGLAESPNNATTSSAASSSAPTACDTSAKPTPTNTKYAQV